MKIAYFDTIAGISGDMTLGAFVSAGVRIEDLSETVSRLGLQNIELEASHVVRSGITAVKVDVIIPEPQTHCRHLRDILAMIDESNLRVQVKENAKKIFLEVGKAEAKIHSMPIDKIHFHEVGAIDSIVDIVGAAACLDLLGVEQVFSSPVKLGGSGFISAEHGKLPIPSPASVEILRGYPTVLTDIQFELTTPTGAAIIKALSQGVLSSERIRVEAAGYGAGTRDLGEIPNLLRVMIGELEVAGERDEVVMIETNIDDMNPEIYPYLLDKLFSSGVLDAFLVPVLMKKGRPGVLLTVLATRAQLDGVVDIIFSQTTTIGVRVLPVERRKLMREEREVETTLGMVKVKVVMGEQGERFVPEYEECKRLAEAMKVPLIEVYGILERELGPKGV